MFSRRQREVMAGLRAEVNSLQARLASDVSFLDPGDDPIARQALVDASERQTAVGSLLATATTPGELQVARRVALEGLTATRMVRERRGLPLGPDLPSLAETVASPTPVMFDGQQHVAHPEYHPERPHFFGGGRFGGGTAPAGYYRTPFWKKALAIGGAVVGAEMLGDVVGDIFDGDRGFGGDGDWGDRADDGGWGGGGGDWGGDGGGGD